MRFTIGESFLLSGHLISFLKCCPTFEGASFSSCGCNVYLARGRRLQGLPSQVQSYALIENGNIITYVSIFHESEGSSQNLWNPRHTTSRIVKRVATERVDKFSFDPIYCLRSLTTP